MKTLLVPVDFTATSDNAVRFAAEWSKKYGYDRIILLKTFYDSMFENIALSEGYVNVNQDFMNKEREQGLEQLKALCSHLATLTLPHVKVITAVSELPLLRAMLEVVHLENPELIIVGSDNYSYSSDSFIAGNLISIARASPIRVLVVPAEYTYRPVTHALLPYNFNMLNDVSRLNHLKTAPQWNDLELLVLDINATDQSTKRPEALNAAEDKLRDLLKNFQFEIFYSADTNLIHGIAAFTLAHDVQLIIALPGRHSFLYTLTHKSISQAIYRNARQPVLILK